MRVSANAGSAPEVECIGKGKARKPWEFGCKVSLATHMKPAKGGHFILHAQALHGRPYGNYLHGQQGDRINALLAPPPASTYGRS